MKNAAARHPDFQTEVANLKLEGSVSRRVGERLRLVKIQRLPQGIRLVKLARDERAKRLPPSAEPTVGPDRPEKRQAQVVQVRAQLLGIKILSPQPRKAGNIARCRCGRCLPES